MPWWDCGGGRRERRDRVEEEDKGRKKKKKKIWVNFNVVCWVLDTSKCLNFREGT